MAKKYIKNREGVVSAITTENLQLEKPLANENYDIKVHNRNMDKIDSAIQEVKGKVDGLELTAERVSIADHPNKFEATNVEDALLENKTSILANTNSINTNKTNINNLNANFTEVNNISYSFDGVTKTFNSKNGYIDINEIKGKTYTNWVSSISTLALTESSGNIFTNKGTVTESNGVYSLSSPGEWDDHGEIISVNPNTTYTFSFNLVSKQSSRVNGVVAFYSAYPILNSSNANASTYLSVHKITDVPLGTNYITFTTPANCLYAVCLISCEGQNVVDKVSNVMFYEGSEQRPYCKTISSVGNSDNLIITTRNSDSTKQDSRKISTTLRSISNNVRDTITKSGNDYVLTTKCKQIVLNGSESWTKNTEETPRNGYSRFHVAISDIKASSTCISTKLKFKTGATNSENKIYVTTNKNISITVLDSIASDTSKLKTWLKSNPITVVYELEAPITTKLHDFNLQTYDTETTLTINGNVKPYVSFSATNSFVNGINNLKNKVSSIDNAILNMSNTYSLNSYELESKVSILEAENKNLKIEQEQQNEEILVNMLANTEMFEMLLGMIPMTLSEDKTKNSGGSSMIEVYCTLIIKNVKTIDDVPLVIREQVIERLKQLEVPVKQNF